MKKTWRGLLFALALLTGAAALSGTAALAAGPAWVAENGSAWTAEDGTAEGGKLSATGADDMKASYGELLDVTAGVVLSYDIEDFTLNTEIGGEESGRQRILFTFLDAAARNGLTVEIYPYRIARGAQKYQRMVAVVDYLVAGEWRNRIWYFDTYRDVFEETHTVSVQHSYGSYYVEADGRVFSPYRPADALDLSAVKLTVETHSANAETPAKLDVKSVAAERQQIAEGDWLDMGPSEHVYNPDGSITYRNIDEQYTADLNSGNYWLKTRIGAVRGYDVTKPIKLQAHYDINGAGVWWGLYFPNRPFLPFDQTRYTIDDVGDNMVNCKGIQFDNTTPYYARPYYMDPSEQASDEELAKRRMTQPKGISVAYGGGEHLNTIEILIGEQATTVKFNGALLWDDFELKRADFSAENGGDGKVYPMFEFIETPATGTRGIHLTVKGINVPEITSATNVTRARDDTADLKLQVTDPGNGRLRLLGPDRSELSADLYSFSAGTFTVKAAAFANLAVNEQTPYSFFIANDGGLAGIQVRILAEVVALQPAVFTPGSYALATKGEATEDLELTVDYRNGTFVSFIGGGLTNSQFTRTDPAAGSTVGKIVLSKDFLNRLKEGETTVRLKTKDVSGNTAETSFVIRVGESGGGEEKGGCGGAAATAAGLPLLGGLVLAAVAMALLRRGKN